MRVNGGKDCEPLRGFYVLNVFWRHLVLAPPGSGKTEMLSARIAKALESGVDPKRMLCVELMGKSGLRGQDRLLEMLKGLRYRQILRRRAAALA